jgi:hypothetical protein
MGDYGAYYGQQATLWNAGAGLCETAAGASTAITLNTSVPCPAGSFYVATAAGPVTGAYISGQQNVAEVGAGVSQYFGPYDSPTFRISAYWARKPGSDPFLGGAWVGANEYFGVLSYSAKGHESGPIRPSTGVAGDNVLQASFWYRGLNGQMTDGDPGGAASLNQMYQSSGANQFTMDMEYVHWFTKNVYLGLGWVHWNTLSGTMTPAGGTTCPGCTLQGYGNGFFLNSWSYF